MKQEHIARVKGLELPISTKVSVEICNYIKHKNLNKAKALLQNVLEKKTAVPYKRYNKDTAHKPGKIAAGKYPVKATQHFIKLLNSLQINAENKGLNPENLIIYFASANKAAKIWHYGRKRRRKMKRTHVELKVKEQEEKKKETKPKEVKVEKKTETPKAKPEVKEIKAPESVEG